jgi:hypothetical protein
MHLETCSSKSTGLWQSCRQQLSTRRLGQQQHGCMACVQHRMCSLQCHARSCRTAFVHIECCAESCRTDIIPIATWVHALVVQHVLCWGVPVLQGIAKARDVGFLDASGGSWRFDLAEYEHYEQVTAVNSSYTLLACVVQQLHAWHVERHTTSTGSDLRYMDNVASGSAGRCDHASAPARNHVLGLMHVRDFTSCRWRTAT